MGDKFGVIDLGSNTFHLLIVEQDSYGKFKKIHKERLFVGLAEDGIDVLSPGAIRRGLDALKAFKKTLAKHKVSHYRAIGTSAIRSTINGQDFVKEVKHKLKISIEVIDGHREAELIYKGVSSCTNAQAGNHVIMDVGGGSVEFIIIKNGDLIWAKSYNIGVGVLYNLTLLEDPISKDNIHLISSFLDKNLSDLKEVLKKYTINSLIGASGSFEIIQNINGDEFNPDSTSEIDIDKYFTLSKRIIASSHIERTQMENLPQSRIKLIVVALLLIDKAMEIIQPKKMEVSPYALKEGVLMEFGAQNK